MPSFLQAAIMLAVVEIWQDGGCNAAPPAVEVALPSAAASCALALARVAVAAKAKARAVCERVCDRPPRYLEPSGTLIFLAPFDSGVDAIIAIDEGGANARRCCTRPRGMVADGAKPNATGASRTRASRLRNIILETTHATCILSLFARSNLLKKSQTFRLCYKF